MGKIYVGDIGTEVILDCGVNVEAATALAIQVKKPSGTTTTWTAVLEGTNSLKHVVTSGELDESGTWALQAYVTTPSWTGRGETVYMTVSGEYQ